MLVGAWVPACAQAEGVETHAEFTVRPGPLYLAGLGPQAVSQLVPVAGSSQDLQADLPSWRVVDATGSGNGWHVQFQTAQLSAGDGQALPCGTLTAAVPPATEVAGSNSPQSLGATVIDCGPGTVVSAAPNAGMGTFRFGTSSSTGGEIAVTLPNGETLPSQSIDLTVTISSGPGS